MLDTQEPAELALSKLSYELPQVMEALARCGDKKYATIVEMTNADRIKGMLCNVLDESTELEIIKEVRAHLLLATSYLLPPAVCRLY